MDTRRKIVSPHDAAKVAASGATVVSGYFDPLLAAHASRLSDLKRKGVPLLALIVDPEDPILPARARAELVAGLAAVDYVAESSEGLVPHINLEEEHEALRNRLIERVHARQTAEA
ncbi:MAG TPA: hypothetical protein VFW83_11525 [Bryobacteraceae bacterium]|nr:hypothetical protein [Bryobacteraceae bacterium]